MSDYDKYLLRPVISNVNSRDDVDLSVDLGKGLVLKIPIIGSPMKGIMSIELAEGLARFGGIGILHRFYDIVNDEGSWSNDLTYLEKHNILYGASVGLDDTFYKYILGHGARILCIDIANGYLTTLLNFCNEVATYIEKNNLNALLMSGNVCTNDGVGELARSGVDLIRFGIGTGHLCTTRKVTGIGRDQVDGLFDYTTSRIYNVKIISDGGIQSSGDAVKALAFGANAIMLGSLLGKTYESAHNGIIYGMASRRLQEEYYHSTKSIEGTEEETSKNISLEEFIDEFCYGIKSACTYLNVKNLDGLRKEGCEQYRKYYVYK